MKVIKREYILYPSKYFGALVSERPIGSRIEIGIWTQKTYIDSLPEFHVTYVLIASNYDASIYFHMRSVAVVDWEDRLPNEWELWEEIVLVAKDSFMRFAQESIKKGKENIPTEPDIYTMKDHLMPFIREEIDRIEKYGK